MVTPHFDLCTIGPYNMLMILWILIVCAETMFCEYRCREGSRGRDHFEIPSNIMDTGYEGSNACILPSHYWKSNAFI